ncbi:ATP-binding protein [Streptomyces sp. ICBB 8177]|uniref:ATP-binding protein n=1 Tax=Streptomyces sp. ICBB 8177 TaxID=563922 RepID=UPI000D681778|nr:ATP-binding protein [Streptomyces sp. ICBB 8177]PWI45991.1 hypothetical protein CK485_02300 [Streptomyces sp. ICBB 8177]
MNTEIAHARDTTPAAEGAAGVRGFAVQLSPTRRGARLARQMAAERLAAWGWPYDSVVSRDCALLVAELATNAVLHGRVPGRDFLLRLTVGGGTVRVEVTDARAELRPAPAHGPDTVPPEAEGGRGLLLVAALASRWGVTDEPPGKTVWCELAADT